ncbi:hypothetical protein [Psychrobacter immobilis]|uniref:hypothetical protein n=1 Tax=Psychrobacter immobilis TaxID=498 RepID=UPI001917B352|nr:hypothetical protein [Psychrobacter immobilis]
MSSNHINNYNRQCCSKRALSDSPIHNENSHAYQPHKLTSIARYALLLGSASLILAGCQSSPANSSSTAASNKMIDFNTADSAQNQAQGRAFNANLTAKSAHYDQLFDQEKYPNTENQAKLHLMAAIRQHLATEHVAVAQANYQSVPFIDPDSIDAGSNSLLRTIIEAYAYEPGLDSDDSEESYNDDADVDDADEAVIFEESASIESVYDDSSYGDSNDDSYNNDYDDVTEMAAYDDSKEYEAAENAVAVAAAAEDAAAVLDEAGENEESNYDEYEEEGSDNEYGRKGILSGMSGSNLKGLARNYEAMQIAKQQPKSADESDDTAPPTGVIGQMLSMFHRTPEQIAATNAYQYKYLTFNSVSQYKPAKRQLQSVYSYDYMTPTIGSSVQIPLAFDFNNSSVTLDPSAIMPIVALINPKNTPLPNQMASHTVSFGLPESITSQLPPAILYDALIAAIQSSMAELAPEHFSAVDIRQDRFAKEVGASRAVKLYFGSQQSGEMVGKVLKYMTRSLQSYVDTNPDKYPDGAVLKAALDKMALYNKGYQSADVGALLQIIEAIGPVSFNQINYYYLDNSDRLLAKQQRMNIGGDLLGATTTVLNQVRYDKASFNNHVLTPLLVESFGEKAKPAIDGNAWIANQRQQKDRMQMARYARYDYSDGGLDYDSEDDSDRDRITEADYASTDADSDIETDNIIEIQ